MEPELRTRTRNPELRTQNIRLHAIVDVDVAAAYGWKPVDLARAFVDGGAPLIQVRAKLLPSGPFLTLCDEVMHAVGGSETVVVVNDRVDLAALSGAAGVHVGQDDLPPAEARRILGDGAVIGYSTHIPAQIEMARREPISYLAVGPVFGTRTKETGYDPLGLPRVAEAVRLAAGRTVVAIGGITLENAPLVIEAGVTSVAVIADLLAGGNPAARVRLFISVLDRSA